jgi:hypothetical protein
MFQNKRFHVQCFMIDCQGVSLLTTVGLNECEPVRRTIPIWQISCSFDTANIYHKKLSFFNALTVKIVIVL